MKLSVPIAEVKRMAVHDGPGVRTTVFLKGCPLRCVWCHNPEGIRPGRQLMVSRVRCISCGACEAVCPQHCIDFTTIPAVILAAHCLHCGNCAEVCPQQAVIREGAK